MLFVALEAQAFSTTDDSGNTIATRAVKEELNWDERIAASA